MQIDGEYETDYWSHVILDFRSDKGNVGSRPIHSQKAELEQLRDDVLDQLDDHEQSDDPFFDDPDFGSEDLAGFPEERMVSREYTHRLVALFAISCGIMEKQLEILLSQDLIPDSRRDGIVSSCFKRRGLHDNLDFAEAAGVIGNGVYSEATDVRKTRNRLVHNPTFRLSIDSYNTHRQRIKKTVRAPDKLDDLIQQAVA